MHSLQNVEVLRQMAVERQEQLVAAAARVAGGRVNPVRVWIGRRIVELGAWVAHEPAIAPTFAR